MWRYDTKLGWSRKLQFPILANASIFPSPNLEMEFMDFLSLHNRSSGNAKVPSLAFYPFFLFGWWTIIRKIQTFKKLRDLID